MPYDQPCSLGAEPLTATVWADEGPEAAGAVRLVPVIEYDFTDHGASLLLDHGEHQSVV